MEPRFNTSFIPKQTLSQAAPASTPRVSHAAGPRSWGMLLTFVVFIIAVLISGGLLAYRWYLSNDIENMLQTLDNERQAFQPALIKELVRLDTRINSAQAILAGHLAPSRLMELLEDTTLSSVRFTDFTYASISANQIAVELSGTARSFESVALQSDVFGGNEHFRSPVFSGIDLDESGSVVFKVSMNVSPDLLRYADTVVAAPASQSPQSSSPSSEQTGTAPAAGGTAGSQQQGGASAEAESENAGSGNTGTGSTGAPSGGSTPTPPPPAAPPGQQ